MKAQLISLTALLAIPLHASAFTTIPSHNIATTPSVFPLNAISDQDGTSNNGVTSIDVSDLGITISDLEKSIPKQDISLESSGYQSTSKIPDVNDDGCHWVENPEDIEVTLRIPGLVGQPAEALSVMFSTTTVSVTAFGRIAWSAIQMGMSDIDDCSFLIVDGIGGIPTIQLSIGKRDVDERWGGFILQVGEDSLL
mmetsp:Transcript_21420/g.46525  ORF Transcript_21420/g.46525 Transcript_21420/m.46525 type:complete len:196 (-) Transcript_21420:373-960(-)|eukprot:CAMPEP_0172317548 /NCGR_PEP_ID=MMETSP1058-20130122/31966_1 /TAXON_ID=83371 /ORGANISM="Detonula confervacea, Strain CCMP 353" /LENGTH=195 /DNA_ID=CAMNT_0013032133 /DNA_START=80 /DNA_END=667 /DNA_ORIENTATION=-